MKATFDWDAAPPQDAAKTLSAKTADSTCYSGRTLESRLAEGCFVQWVASARMGPTLIPTEAHFLITGGDFVWKWEM
jgi:hypothetical protein